MTLIKASGDALSQVYGMARLRQARLRREHRTMAAVLALFCHAHHTRRRGGRALCRGCQELLDYAGRRLERCRFQEHKPTCANCSVHCYGPQERERVREVMRYAGPRMLWRHPVLALHHLVDGWLGPRPRRTRSGSGEQPAIGL